ncbi:hypothetical protein L916_12989 [Phytophthora nicotianae]|uniref:M96 mating-specific protein family n=1 Tax=Phytophthora nicotianae TaxID=4792 RepID=W2IL20_PHYNI|nr:hypothetical protein L916_12989 [Phytophthora nicotianae]
MTTDAPTIAELVDAKSRPQGPNNEEKIKAEELVITDAVATSELAQVLSQDADVETDIVMFELQASKPKTRAEKEAIRKRKYHHRLRNERESLRQLVSELSAQLQELRLSRGLCTSQEDITVLVNAKNWKEVALLRRQLRQRSETEQMQLFTAAKLQAMYINKLCAQLPGNSSRRLQTETDTRPMNPPFDYTKYRALVQRVNSCYADVDNVLQEFTEQYGVMSSLHYRDKDGSIEYFQHLHQFSVPYNYEQTRRTMWKLSNLFHRQQDRQVIEGLGSPDDTVVLRFRLVRPLTSGVIVSVLQRYVVRRYNECNRTVIVWKTLSEGENGFAGLQAEETGWLCLQPSTEEGSTLARICVRQAPTSFCIPMTCESISCEFAQVLRNSVGEDMLEISTALDRMLLDDTLEGIDI